MFIHHLSLPQEKVWRGGGGVQNPWGRWWKFINLVQIGCMDFIRFWISVLFSYSTCEAYALRIFKLSTLQISQYSLESCFSFMFLILTYRHPDAIHPWLDQATAIFEQTGRVWLVLGHVGPRIRHEKRMAGFHRASWMLFLHIPTAKGWKGNEW